MNVAYRWSLLFMAFLACAISGSAIGQVVFTASGANPAAIQATVDSFRTALGTLNPNTPGSVGSGRREINWDGVPDALAAPNNLPANFFNVNSPRGVVFTTPGTGFQVSANAGVAPVRFDNINPNYSTIFQTFSAQRLFTALGSNVVDVNFFVPGSNAPALTKGFGAVFTDVDTANVTSIQLFDKNNVSLGQFFALPANNGLSFLGILEPSSNISRVRIISGNAALGAGVTDNNGNPNDLVVMDDFIYGEPIAAILPPTISKSFGAASIPLGGSTTLSFTIQNPNAATTLTGVGFSDTLPAGLVVATPNGLTGSCGGGSITAVAGSNSVSLTGGTIAAGANCIFGINVTGVSAGTQNNVTSVVASTNGGNGNTGAATLIVVAPPVIAKSFADSTIPVFASSTVTFTISNPLGNTVPLTGVGFVDTFPLGSFVVASPNGLTGSCGGGTITAVSGADSITLAGVTLPIGGSCTFSVNISPTASGTFINTTTVTSANAGTGNTAAATIVSTPRIIPTLQGWGLILLGLSLAGAGWVVLGGNARRT